MLYAALAAWVMGTVGTALAIRYARARSLVDQPGDRRSHSAPTPRGGGMAIVTAVVAISLWLLVRQWGGGDGGLLSFFLAGFTLVAFVGWVDDHRSLPAFQRLLVHVAAAAMFAGAFWAATAHTGLTILAFAAPLVLTNVWNFMDGINGIAATQAVVVAAFLTLALDGVWMTLAVTLAVAAWAFLPYNFPRAKVFMGDVGSGAIGFAMGCLLAIAAWKTMTVSPAKATVWLLALPVSAFLVDATLTLAWRILRRERWWTPHVQHAYQGAARQVGHGRVTMGFLTWTLLGSGLVVSFRAQSDFFVLSVVLGWYTLGALLWWQLQRWVRSKEGALRSRNSA